MKVSELESLQRKSKLTDEDRKRIRELTPKTVKRVNAKREIKPAWMGLDEIHIKFVGPIEPWTVVRCAVCDKKYHLVDLADCECGLEESKERRTFHLGEFKIGTK